MDAWPTFWNHNKPLYEAHIEAGFKFKHGNGVAHFVDQNGKYATYPKGYITGVQYRQNGSPRPYYASVYLGDSWMQYTGKTDEECVIQALERAKEVTNP